jgi:NADH dehydrogenase/NADH:ubiquinone oxidoreductase subunit G
LVWLDDLYAQKTSIESTFGQPLIWERLDNKRASRVKYEIAGEPFDEAQRPALNSLIAGSAVASIVTKLKELEAEKVKLTAELAAKGQVDTVLRHHPKAAERYQRALENLGDTLRDASTEEHELIRSLIQSVTVFNEPDGAVSVALASSSEPSSASAAASPKCVRAKFRFASRRRKVSLRLQGANVSF